MFLVEESDETAKLIIQILGGLTVFLVTVIVVLVVKNRKRQTGTSWAWLDILFLVSIWFPYISVWKYAFRLNIITARFINTTHQWNDQTYCLFDSVSGKDQNPQQHEVNPHLLFIIINFNALTVVKSQQIIFYCIYLQRATVCTLIYRIWTVMSWKLQHWVCIQQQ